MRERYFGYSPPTDAVIEESCARSTAAGAVLVDPANLATAKEIDAPEFEVLLYEFKADLEAYFASLGRARRCARCRT
jgi:amidase